jgi:hypothetical protein
VRGLLDLQALISRRPAAPAPAEKSRPLAAVPAAPPAIA